jgi:hypothetical protein
MYTKRELVTILDLLNNTQITGEANARALLIMIDKTKILMLTAFDDTPKPIKTKLPTEDKVKDKRHAKGKAKPVTPNSGG